MNKKVQQWCLDLVDSDLVDCRDLVDYFCCLSGNKNGQIKSYHIGPKQKVGKGRNSGRKVGKGRYL